MLESRSLLGTPLPRRSSFPRREGDQGVRSPAPIGIFDSGVGGLSVLRPLRELLPALGVIYVADTAWCPYGPKPAHVIRQRVEAITCSLLALGVTEVVVACNTASTVALAHLRRRFSGVSFVGMEPAVKPAAAQTRTGAIGVLATAATAKGEALARLVDRFGRGVAVHVAVPEGLVELVEQGRGDSPAAAALLRPILRQFAAQKVDVIVLGCTHYPFALPTIQRLAGRSAAVIDPAPAVALQAARVWAERSSGQWSVASGQGRGAVSAPAIAKWSDVRWPLEGDAGTRGRGDTERDGQLTFLTSGEVEALRQAVSRLMPPGWADGATFSSLNFEAPMEHQWGLD